MRKRVALASATAFSMADSEAETTPNAVSRSFLVRGIVSTAPSFTPNITVSFRVLPVKARDKGRAVDAIPRMYSVTFAARGRIVFSSGGFSAFAHSIMSSTSSASSKNARLESTTEDREWAGRAKDACRPVERMSLMSAVFVAIGDAIFVFLSCVHV